MIATREPLVSIKSLLPARHLEILRLKFKDGYTEAEIGELFGIDQGNVSRAISWSLIRCRSVRNLVIEFD